MQVLIKPLVTEKFSSMNEHGKYGFIVFKSSNKIQIKKEIEKKYGVSVESINTMIQIGKSKQRYTKSKAMKGKTATYKKVIVRVAEGEIIDFHSES